MASRMLILVSGARLPLREKDDFTVTGRKILEKCANPLFHALQTLSILSAALVLNFS